MGERLHEVWSVPPPVSTRLRPCWTAILSILQRHSPLVSDMQTIKIQLEQNGFSASC